MVFGLFVWDRFLFVVSLFYRVLLLFRSFVCFCVWFSVCLLLFVFVLFILLLLAVFVFCCFVFSFLFFGGGAIYLQVQFIYTTLF